LHFAEQWFHSNLGRESAERLLRENAHMGDGTFVVRASQTFIGDYSLSFLRKGHVSERREFPHDQLCNKGLQVWHVPIRSRQRENGSVRYFLIEQVFFDSLYNLISYYQGSPLVSSKFSITLGKAVPPPNQHEGMVGKIG
jgi:phosphatidylinositol phospholipase C gamma-1